MGTTMRTMFFLLGSGWIFYRVDRTYLRKTHADEAIVEHCHDETEYDTRRAPVH
jgi:hypothetical protein